MLFHTCVVSNLLNPVMKSFVCQMTHACWCVYTYADSILLYAQARCFAHNFTIGESMCAGMCRDVQGCAGMCRDVQGCAGMRRDVQGCEGAWGRCCARFPYVGTDMVKSNNHVVKSNNHVVKSNNHLVKSNINVVKLNNHVVNSNKTKRTRGHTCGWYICTDIQIVHTHMSFLSVCLRTLCMYADYACINHTYV